MKVQVNLNENLVKKIDAYAAAIGQSRSAVCAIWIGQAVLGIDKATELLQSVGTDVAKALGEEGSKKKDK